MSFLSPYRPDREPPGYWQWLQSREPETVFDTSKLRTEDDWIAAGRQVFSAGIVFGPADKPGVAGIDLRNVSWYEGLGVRTTPEGIVPSYQYVVRERADAMPPGVFARQGTSPSHPTHMPI